MSEEPKVVPFVKFQQLKQLATALIRRSKLASLVGKTFDGNRDLYDKLGYKRVIDFKDYDERYDRGGIAARVVDSKPQATWRNIPVLRETGQTEWTPFVEEWEKLARRLNLFHYLERVDRIGGVGRYGVLLVGVRGGRRLESAIPRVKSPDDILYLAPFSEGNAAIHQLEADAANERFGLPSVYSLDLQREVEGSPGLGIPANSVEVHHSRVIHVAEGLKEDDIFGTPRMQQVWNYLDDLDKVVGGSSEALWRTVDRGMQFDVDKDMELSPDDAEDFSDEMDEYEHGLRRFIRTRGITVTPLGSDVPDPRGQFSVLASLIAGTTGIPQRVMFGSERGQLASTQDERNYHARVQERQTSFAEPKILRPLVDLFIEIGALPEPANGYKVKWPDLSVLTLRERADVAARFAQAIRNVAAQTKEGKEVVSPEEFVRMFLRSDEEEG